VKISACIITLNEEANLQRCLKSCAHLVDEIVVLDSGSTDGTEAIAREFGARWLVQEWPGYMRQKNNVIQLASHEWVLSLDADESISADLLVVLERLKQEATPSEVSGYSMTRCVFYKGRWIRHGDWYPDRLVRLFRHEKAVFAGGRVHERLELNGEVRELSGDIEHYSFTDSADHWARAQHYARLWAESSMEQGRTAGVLSPIFHATFKWFRGYVLRHGFLDGRLGWQIAILNSREVYLKYELLRQMNIARST
jgi:glycosyltransferase involved in cell wall biosynthesis